MMEEGKGKAVVGLKVAVEGGAVTDSLSVANAASRDLLQRW